MLGSREIRKLIGSEPIYRSKVGRRLTDQGYQIFHRIPGEAILCEVPTLEMAACIVKALRERCALKEAAKALADHMKKQEAKRDTKENTRSVRGPSAGRQIRRTRRD